MIKYKIKNSTSKPLAFPFTLETIEPGQEFIYETATRFPARYVITGFKFKEVENVVPKGPKGNPKGDS